MRMDLRAILLVAAACGLAPAAVSAQTTTTTTTAATAAPAAASATATPKTTNSTTAAAASSTAAQPAVTATTATATTDPATTATIPAAASAKPKKVAAKGNCVTLGFEVNDYGKDGPTKDAKALLDGYVAKWATANGIKTYKMGAKSVDCKLFLDFIVFDEHTCTASANVCWQGAPTKEALVTP